MVNAQAPRIVAIDGPAGAGKSTVGRALAARLGLAYLDTGAMYRAITWGIVSRGIDPVDGARVGEALDSVDLEIRADGSVWVDGVDVTNEIRGRAVTAAVSHVAAHPAVRRRLVAEQRQWVAERNGAVVEGRDISTVVFPGADLKLYITASAAARADRRVREVGGDRDEIEAAISERDRLDSTRDDSPLVEAADAQVIDTTGMTVVEVVDHVAGLLPPTIGGDR